MQLHKAPREPIGWQETDFNVFATDYPPSVSANDEKAGRGIEYRRHPAPTIRNRDHHNCLYASCLPAWRHAGNSAKTLAIGSP